MASARTTDSPVLQVLDDLVTDESFHAAQKVCAGAHWHFGQGSHDGDLVQFWKMDLDGNAVFEAIWQQMQKRCEELAGTPLRVIRQYANGHTYGMGGKAHPD